MDTNSSNKNLACLWKNAGFIRIAGEQAKQLMQGQFSCDINLLDNKASLRGVHCNPKGRIISLFRLFQIDGDYYLLLPKNNIENTLQALGKYAPFFKVSLEDVSEQLACLECHGEVIKQQLNLFEQDENAVIFSVSSNSEDTRHLVIGKPDLINAILTTLSSYAEETSHAYWQYLNTIYGTTEIYAETSEKILPHHINLHNTSALNFKKGCYTGQEIIARMQYLGQLKQALYSLSTENTCIISPGDTIFDEEEKRVGMVVLSCTYHEKTYMLATIKSINIENVLLKTNHTSVKIIRRFD